jgi:ABC-type antimicrobial peptide transport system permease subunit
MALGAQTNGILRQVLGVGLRLTAAGTALGLLASLPLARLVESQLHEIQTHDPPVLVASSCLIGLVALISCLVPARRAAGCDIVQGLRHE